MNGLYAKPVDYEALQRNIGKFLHEREMKKKNIGIAVVSVPILAAGTVALASSYRESTNYKPSDAFTDCVSLKTLNITGGAWGCTIYPGAFYNCNELTVPFVCIATENPPGFAGTQSLPESQLDRFMVCLSIGYPSLENQMLIINAQRYNNPLLNLKTVTSVQSILEIQNYLTSVKIADSVLRYAILLCEETRKHPLVELGISPRGVSALVKMAEAGAIMKERNYMIPEDIQSCFVFIVYVIKLDHRFLKYL